MKLSTVPWGLRTAIGHSRLERLYHSSKELIVPRGIKEICRIIICVRSSNINCGGQQNAYDRRRFSIPTGNS